MHTSAVAASTFPLAVRVMVILLATVVGNTPNTINPPRMNLSILSSFAAEMMLIKANMMVGKRSREKIWVIRWSLILRSSARRDRVLRVRPVIKKIRASAPQLMDHSERIAIVRLCDH